MTRSTSESAPLLLFDATAGGHHPEYVQHLVDGAAARGRTQDIALAVPEAMLAAHPSLTASGARTFPLPTARSFSSPWAASQFHWSLLNEAASAVRPARVLLLFADAVVPTLATHVRLPGYPRLWTIHFRPPVRQPGVQLRERVRDVVKRRHLHALLRHPDLQTAFTLDPRALASFQTHARTAQSVALADPVARVERTREQQAEDRHRVRHELGVKPGRHLMVLFGSLEPRKGIFQTVEALRHLRADAAEQLTVALVGSVYDGCREAFMKALAVTKQATLAQVLLRDHVLDEAEIDPLLVAADTVLIPYQRHIGSSGVLIRAAGLQRPTITQDVGLVGHWTRTHHLGRTVDSTSPKALAHAMEAALADPAAALNRQAALAFADEHTPDAFVRALLDAPAGALL
ncbi:MAG TPA: glycosyltransferase [Rubricoccaceae bacterium]|jgi:hypothetical protein